MSSKPIYKSEAGRAELMAWYEKGLDQWNVPYRQRIVETRHGRTALLEAGPEDGASVVLLHGSSSNAVFWAAEAERLSRSMRVFAVDTLGEPGHSDQNRPSWKDHSFAEWLHDLLDGLDLQQAAIVGLSQGGWIALRFASVFPERVSHLALLAPAGLSNPRTRFLVKSIALSMLGKRGVRTMVSAVVAPRKLDPEVLSYIEAIHAHFRPRIDAMPLMSDDELRCLSMPVMMIAGKLDAFYDSGVSSARMLSLVPHADVRIIECEGHALDDHSDLLEAFLDTPQQPL